MFLSSKDGQKKVTTFMLLSTTTANGFARFYFLGKTRSRILSNSSFIQLSFLLFTKFYQSMSTYILKLKINSEIKQENSENQDRGNPSYCQKCLGLLNFDNHDPGHFCALIAFILETFFILEIFFILETLFIEETQNFLYLIKFKIK